MKQKQITLNDIAQQLNVSKVTVSKALRDHPDIGPEMKRRVRATAESMGYVPNLIARNLSARRSQTIGLVVPKIAHHFFSSTIEAIYQAAAEHQYEVILTVSQENATNEIKHINTLLSMRVDGLLVSVTAETRDLSIFEKIKNQGVPLVFFDRAPAVHGFSRVTCDDEGGSYLAVKQMIQAGYRKIAHLAGYAHTNIGTHRRNGFLKAMYEHGLTIPDNYVLEGGFAEADGQRGFELLFQNPSPPEAIFTVTYPVAMGVLYAARQAGVLIPEDLDIISFGGSTYNRLLRPALTFVDQPTEKIGKTATEMLLEEIVHPEYRGREIIIPTKLIKCETCINCIE